jgi:hypothetical protein
MLHMLTNIRSIDWCQKTYNKISWDYLFKTYPILVHTFTSIAGHQRWHLGIQSDKVSTMKSCLRTPPSFLPPIETSKDRIPLEGIYLCCHVQWKAPSFCYGNENLKYYLNPSLTYLLITRAALRINSIGPQPVHNRDGWGGSLHNLLCVYAPSSPSSHQTSKFHMHKLNIYSTCLYGYILLLYCLYLHLVVLGLGWVLVCKSFVHFFIWTEKKVFACIQLYTSVQIWCVPNCMDRIP